MTSTVLECGDATIETPLRDLLERYGLQLVMHPPGAALPGTWWGEPEAGIIGLAVHVRPDTPLHSALHEAGHLICMEPERRAALHTNAGGDDLEECGVCYLQILLADALPGVGRNRLMQDMDAWGYSFRLGSTARWFEGDADDARAFLRAEGLIDSHERPSFACRGGLEPARDATLRPTSQDATLPQNVRPDPGR
ncbi:MULTISPECIES: hypothetical protein [unclassified Thioalkalivibrio]|uniref:hypothetical protein n=1 Tax=unclassified Thioalkalivibrio TaxID=2621013 RepID=UPI00037155A0|nr:MULTISPECIES: hypothetical protein [unclassified Thioalkalivibrio]